MDSFKPMQEERKCKELCLQMRRENLLVLHNHA